MIHRRAQAVQYTTRFLLLSFSTSYILEGPKWAVLERACLLYFRGQLPPFLLLQDYFLPQRAFFFVVRSPFLSGQTPPPVKTMIVDAQNTKQQRNICFLPYHLSVLSRIRPSCGHGWTPGGSPKSAAIDQSIREGGRVG